MTLSELRTLQTNFLSLDLDNFAGESPSTSDQNAQINWAYRRIARKCCLIHPKIPMTLTADTALYSLANTAVWGSARRMVDIYSVTINGVPLRDCLGRNYGMWTYREFMDRHPTWQTASSGVPTKALVVGANLLLHQPPTSAVVSAGDNYVAGQYIPADLDGSTYDTPDLPDEIQPAIAYLAAIYAATPLATEPEMWTRLQAFGQAWVEMIDDISHQNRMTLMNPGSMAGDAFEDVMRV